MGERPDQLRAAVDEQREDAAQKIDEIERRVNATVRDVQDGIDRTGEQVRATVQGSVQDVQDTVGATAHEVTDQVRDKTLQVAEQVKEIDWARQVEERPLMLLGAAFAGGFLLGSITGGDDGHDTRTRPGEQRQHSHERGGGLAAGVKRMARESGLEETLSSAAAAAMGTANDRLRQILDRQYPGFAARYHQAEEADGGFSAKREAAMQTGGGTPGADTMSAHHEHEDSAARPT